MTQANQSKKPEHAPLEEPKREKPRLGSDSQAFIGSKLRELYDDVVAEPVPDRFVELLKKLGDDEKASE
ncbi:NepR family anti-sigma factor [Pelagibacterium halotolerans]|uniref:NepR family anti-sigma factor n=1 Tax=Pelagibacterium halotolerans TaxID=531813 RepID=UPI00384F53B3